MELFFRFKKSENFTDVRQWVRAGTRFFSGQSSPRVGLTVALGIVLSCGAFAMAWHWEGRLLQAKFRTLSDDFTAALQGEIDDHLAVLQHLSDFYATGDRANPKDARRFVKRFLSRLQGIESLGWMPRISATERQSVEAEMRAAGYPNLRIPQEDSQGMTRISAQRAEYFPIAYMEGLGDSEMAVGFDMGSDLTRFALEQARERGAIAISAQLPQALPKNGNVDFLALLPIEVLPEPSSRDISDRDREISGFVLGIFNLSEILKVSLEKQNSSLATFANTATIIFYGGSASAAHSAAGSGFSREAATARGRESPQFFAFYDARTGKLSADSTRASSLETTGESAIARALSVGNEEWTVEFLPAPAYRTDRAHFGAWAVLVLGLFSTGVLAGCQRIGRLRSLDREQLWQQREKAIASLKQVNASLSQANAEMKLLSRMSNSLQACLTQEEAYTTVRKFMRKLFPNLSGALYMISAAGNLVEASATWGESTISQLVFSPDECWGMRYGQPYMYKNAHSSFGCQHGSHPLPEESLCLPLVAHGETWGLLYLSSPAPGRLSDDKQHLAKSVSEHVALALANLKLRETLEYNSIRDPLTNLFNRRYMEEFLSQELHRAQRAGHSVGVIMLDVDHFKRFNDTFGHKTGDELLRSLGAFLLASIRGSDIACRYGGEEFTLILPEASLSTTRERAEQLRSEVQHRLASSLELSSNRQVTLSLGVASFPQHGLTAEAIVRAADAALYRAKAEGRDRVVTAS